MRFVLAFLVAATLVFAAGTQHRNLTLDQAYTASGKLLQAGNYRVVIEGNHATLMRGRKDILTNIKVETNASKYNHTAMRSTKGNMSASQRMLTEVDLGGTHEKLVFD